jgi:hypothetical protein
MPASLQICRCVANGCSSTPIGFRALHKAAFSVHSADEKIRKGLLEGNHPLIESVTRAFAEHKRNQAPIHTLIFLPNLAPAGELGFAPLKDLLDPGQCVNEAYLLHAAWYSQAMKSLSSISPSGRFSDQVFQLRQQLMDHESTNRVKILQRLEEVQAERSDGSEKQDEGIGSLNMLKTSLEMEISFGIRRFKLPSDLVFRSNEYLPPSSQTLESLDDHPNNRATLEQMQWISSVSRRLHSVDEPEIGSLRRDELLLGLEEQRMNIVSHVNTMMFKLRQPTEQVVTILQSTLNACITPAF